MHRTNRGLQFSFNIEVPQTQESRLLGIKNCIKMTKGFKTLKKATTSTQNADLVAALLLAFEEKIEGKGLTLSDLSLSSTGSPNHSLVSTPSTTAWFSILSAFLCLPLILFLQCLLYKQSVCHKESKSLHPLQRTSLQWRIFVNSAIFFLEYAIDKLLLLWETPWLRVSCLQLTDLCSVWENFMRRWRFFQFALLP